MTYTRDWKINEGQKRTWSAVYPIVDSGDGKTELLATIYEDGFTIAKQEVLYVLRILGEQWVYTTLADAQWHANDIVATQHNGEGSGWTVSE